MYHIFCIHSSVEGHLGSFQLLAIINKAAMNIVEHVSLLHVGASSGYMPRSGIAVSSRSTMSNFLRNHQTDFQSGCTSLHSVVAIPGCQLDNIWNELQSGIGRLTSDPYLEAWRSLSGSWFEDLEP